jgi:TonB-dependent receptor
MEQAIDGFLRVGSTVTPLSVDSDDLDLLPSLNARWDLNEDTVLRAALVTGIARPGYGAVRTGASVSDVSRTIAGGNPTLEPEKTWGGDVSLERYLPGAGVVSAGAFVRLVDNVLYDAVSTVTSDIYDAPGIDRTGYIYTSTQNGDSGHLYGLELSWQQQFVFLPGLWSGFGVQANVALLDGEFDTRVGQTADFPGTSKTVTNLSVYYEKYGLSARLSHQWRDDWLDSLGGLGSGEYRAGYESLDLSLRYALTDSLTLFVDGNNLTDETYVAFEGDPSRPSEVEQIGARWMAGVRFNF